MPFVSLFCGSCVVEAKVNSSQKILNDKHEYLIAMWQAVQNGYELPDAVSNEDWKLIKANQDGDRALSGFVGFACSYGGRWFEGYARGVGRNYANEAKRGIAVKMNGLRSATFLNLDYRDVQIPQNAVVYCDPPYINTKYFSGVERFNHNEFWEYMRGLSKTNMVFISEQTAPDDFEVVWEKEISRSMSQVGGNKIIVTEKLFIHKAGIQMDRQGTIETFI